MRKQGEIRERWRRRKWALISLGVVMLCVPVILQVAAKERERHAIEMRERVAVAEKQLGRIFNRIGVSGDPLMGKAGLLEIIDLYAWSKKRGIPVSEGSLIALYLAPEQRDKSVPLGPREALERQAEVWRKIPALTAPGGRFTLMIEERKTPVLFDRLRGKVEYLSPSDSPIIQIGFSANSTRVGVACEDGSSIIWEIGNLNASTKTNRPLQTALGLDGVKEESRQELLKSSPEQNLWQAGYTALGQEWLLRALSAVTRSHQDYSDSYKLREDTDKTLTETFNMALQLAGENMVEKAISLLSEELKGLGFKTEGEAQADTRERLRNVLVSSALYRVMEEFQNLRLSMDSATSADVPVDIEPRYEKLVIALDSSLRSKIDALKEIHRGNALAFRGDKEGALEAYSKAIKLDPILAQKLRPEEQVQRFLRTISKAAVQKIESGNEAAQRGELDKAIAFYREAIALDPRLEYSLNPEFEARKRSEKQGGPIGVSPQGQTSQESTQIKK